MRGGAQSHLVNGSKLQAELVHFGRPKLPAIDPWTPGGEAKRILDYKNGEGLNEIKGKLLKIDIVWKISTILFDYKSALAKYKMWCFMV